MMLKVIIGMSLILSSSVFADQFIAYPKNMNNILPASLKSKIIKKSDSKDYTVFQIKDGVSEEISHAIHAKAKKCGGFFNFDSLEEAQGFVKTKKSMMAETALNATHKELRKKIFQRSKAGSDKIRKVIDNVSEIKMRDVIKKLSSYKTRKYNTKSGVEAAKWIAKLWKNIAKGRSDIVVDLYEHSWKQPSVILKIKGTQATKDSYVVGGHLDSIHSSPFGGSAPGADDNASGIATVTEVLRNIVKSNFKPKKNLFFMGYAAEEVGLRGSKDIANRFKKDKKYNVLGAIQFDMTNFRGSKKSIYFVSDYVSSEFTKTLASLVDKYLDVEWGYTKCNYACSDHASWHSTGVPAAFPFESAFNEYNRKIHTSNDTIEQSKGTADHAVNFAKLGLAALLELGSL